MALSPGIDWEGLTGKPMEKITQDDINTVMVGKLINIEQNTRCIKEHENRINRHDTYFKWIGVVIGAIVTALIASIISHLY